MRSRRSSWCCWKYCILANMLSPGTSSTPPVITRPGSPQACRSTALIRLEKRTFTSDAVRAVDFRPAVLEDRDAVAYAVDLVEVDLGRQQGLAAAAFHDGLAPRVDDRRAAAEHLALGFAHPVAAGQEHLVFNGARPQQGLPVIGAAGRPLGRQQHQD